MVSFPASRTLLPLQPQRRDEQEQGKVPSPPAGCRPASSTSGARPPQPCIEEQEQQTTVCAMGEWERRDKVGEKVSGCVSGRER